MRSSSAVFLDVADAIHRIGPGALATADTLKVFGKAGLALEPMLLKGKDAIQPERIETIQVPDGRVTAFLFPRGTVLSKDDKEVVFETARGPMEIKAKFNLAEMDYKGKLEL